MANETLQGKILNFVSGNLPGSVVVLAVLTLVIPISQPVIDLMMILNFTMAIVVLLVVVNTKRPANFLTFPRVTIFVTLFGLGINIASTRLILTGSPKMLRAGGAIKGQSLMVQGFANIVAGNELVIGFVIFVLLVVVQMIVFTKGATRVAEVQARFQLDAMNTKRFDIDSQLQAGEITSEQAKKLKEELNQEIDFYSNMDGSSKFVSGNAKFGIFVTVVNLIGGFIIGMTKNHLAATDCLNIYTRLTIGDGLISQMPSLILTVATGLLITGNKSDSALDKQLKHDFAVDGNIYIIAGFFLILVGFGIAIPNKSASLFFLLAILGGLLIFFGTRMKSLQKSNFAKQLAKEQEEKNTKESGNKTDEVSPVSPLDAISLELGYGLIPLVDKEKGAELLGRITQIRQETATELGLVVPKIRIIDNMQLEPNEYSIKIRGNEAARYKVKPGCYLCMNFGNVIEEVNGEQCQDPCFGAPSVWVNEDLRPVAERNGYSVFDSSTVIATHLTEIIRSHASDILRRKEVAEILNKVKETNPVVVEDVQKTDLSNGDIQKVLQGLLREQISIRDIETILEVLSDYGKLTRSTWDLMQYVRNQLGLQICSRFLDPGSKKLSVLSLNANTAQYIFDHQVVPPDGSEPYVALSPEDERKWINAATEMIIKVRQMSYLPIIACQQEIRLMVRNSLIRGGVNVNEIAVISFNEIEKAGNNVELEVLGEINAGW